MKYWLDIYPHSIFASVLLLDGKIENWKIVNYPKKHPLEFTGFWKRDRLNDYACEWKEFVCNNGKEHNEAFEEWAPEWFKQWLIADDFKGSPPYEIGV